MHLIITSDDLIQGLQDIDRLIASLSPSAGVDEEDLRDLRWLLAKRQSLSALLAVRRAQKGKKVVSLDLWRDGHVVALEGRSQPRRARLSGGVVRARAD
jgi:hypothetical protein